MKKIIVNIMATTTAVTLVLIIVGIITFGAEAIHGFIGARDFLQILLANTVIHVGLIFTRKFESRYAVLEYLLDVSYIIIVILVFGLIFEWYPDSPWLLAVVAVAVYILGLSTGIVRVKKEINDINELLQKRKEKNAESL